MRISDWSFRRVLFRSRALAARGMLEAVTYSFTDGRFAGLFGGGDLRLANPISAELDRSEEHTSELQSLMRNSYAVFCLTKKKTCTDNAVRLLNKTTKQAQISITKYIYTYSRARQ